jgi:hypothetical protein
MFRCPECRTRRANWHLFTKHIEEAQHKVCTCGGYHYPHRPGSPYCTRNAWSEYREAQRRDVDDDTLKDIVVHTAFETRGRVGIDPPF